MDVQELLAISLGLDAQSESDSDCLATRIFGDGFPHVNAVLGVTRAGGVDRQPATLTIFEDSGCASLCLRDRSNGRVLYASGDSFEEAVTELETTLASGKARWRAERGRERRRSS